MKTEIEIDKEIEDEIKHFKKLKVEISKKIKDVDIEDFDTYLDIESAIENMKNCINYYDGLKFAKEPSLNANKEKDK